MFIKNCLACDEEIIVAEIPRVSFKCPYCKNLINKNGFRNLIKFTSIKTHGKETPNSRAS